MRKNVHCGISISGGGLRYVELKKEGTSLKCNARAKVFLPKEVIQMESVIDTEALYLALKKLKKKIGRFGKVKAAFGIPMRDSHEGFVDFPRNMPFDEVIKSLQWQLDQYLPLTAEKAYYDAVEIDFPFPPKDSNQRESFRKYLVIASSKSFIDKIMKAITSAGFFPTALEPTSIALFRSALISPKDSEGLADAFDSKEGYLSFFLGDTISLIALGYKDDGIFYRPVMLGRKTNSEYLVQNIVKEIKFTVDYLNGYYPYFGINRLFLIGLTKLASELRDALKSAVAFPVTLLDPWKNFPLKERPRGGGWEAPLGLALRDII
ncbi:MAG TPA: pilus assembly protein PilM [Acetomicrobium sp.]|nr:pilus assembly protein PilM [Acetomicrobium sp.]